MRKLQPSLFGNIHYIGTAQLTLFLLLVPNFQAQAQQRLPHLYSGECEVNETPEWPILCLQPEAEVSFLSDSSSKDNFYNYYGWHAYGGLHLLETFSLHGIDHGGLFQQRRLNKIDRDQHQQYEYYVAIGNTATSKVRLRAGRINLPFGLGDSFRPRILQLKYDTRAFMDNYGDGVQATYDNLVNARIDFGAALKNDNDMRPNEQIRTNQYAVRSMFDFSALHGTRISLSYYRHEESGISKIGASGYNKVEETGESFIEWVRISNDWRRPFSNNQQIIVFGYRSTMSKIGRGLIRYEFEKEKHRLVDFGYEMSILGPEIFSALVSFEKEETPEYRQLKTLLTFSAQVKL